MLALSIRQPFAELILRGLKTIEYRSRPTRIIGQRFLIYASKRRWTTPAWEQNARTPADNLAVGDAPPWMIELTNTLRLFPAELPMGFIVGSAVVEKCVVCGDGQPADAVRPSATRAQPCYEWHLTDVRRLTRPRKPKRRPQPVWFVE